MTRFQLLDIEAKGRGPVAVIHDRKANRRFRVYRQGRTYLHWSSSYQPVTVRGLRECAREALA